MSKSRGAQSQVAATRTADSGRAGRGASDTPGVIIDPPATAASSILGLAAERVVAGWVAAGGYPAEGAEVALLAEVLARCVQEVRAHRDLAVDERLRSPRGRRVLELLRAEVIRSWSDSAAQQDEIPAILAAIERVREAIERDWAQHFADRLTGVDGLDLLVAIAHDLRSPLTSILFLAETLQREQSGPVNDVQRRQLGLIYGAALGLSSVASDVIELARGGDQLMEREPTPFSVTAMLESVRDIVRPIAEEKRLAVRLLPPSVDYRMGHPVALSRVLLNLTTNALKFTSQGYVEIVTQEKGPVGMEFAVRDSGRGIEPEIVSSLFQPLRRNVGRAGQSFSQTGLGLAMCQKLVEAMDARLKVETRRGWGTRFYFELRLPVCAPPQAGGTPPGSGARRTRSPLPE
jgi:signal transduction histidine kinase